MTCQASMMVFGGTFFCLREPHHKGVHMGESGDPNDYGPWSSVGSKKEFDWELVGDIGIALKVAHRRIGS